MGQGQLLLLTPAHFAAASTTGFAGYFSSNGAHLYTICAGFPEPAAIVGVFGRVYVFADAVVHPSHFGGRYSEATLTGLGAFVFSVVVSYTPVSKCIDRLAYSLRPPA